MFPFFHLTEQVFYRDSIRQCLPKHDLQTFPNSLLQTGLKISLTLCFPFLSLFQCPKNHVRTSVSNSSD